LKIKIINGKYGQKEKEKREEMFSLLIRTLKIE
jgi:hypothetical protein